MKISIAKAASVLLISAICCSGLAPDLPPKGNPNIPDPELPHGDNSDIHPLGHTPQPGAFMARIPFFLVLEPPSADDPLIPRELGERMHPGPWGPPPPMMMGPPPPPGMMGSPLIGPPIMGPYHPGMMGPGPMMDGPPPPPQMGGPKPMNDGGVDSNGRPKPPNMVDFSKTQGEMMRPHPGGGDGSDDYQHPMQGAGDGYWQNKFQKMGGQHDIRNNFDSIVDPDKGYHEEGDYKPLKPPTGNEQHPMQGGPKMNSDQSNKKDPNKPIGMVDFSSTQEEMMRPHPGFDNVNKDNSNAKPPPSPTTGRMNDGGLDSNGRQKPPGMVDFSKTQGEMMRPHPGGGDGSADVIHPVQGAGDGFWQNKFEKRGHEMPKDQLQVPQQFKDWVEDPDDPSNNVIFNKDKNFRIGKEEPFAKRPPNENFMKGPGDGFFQPKQQQPDIPSSGDMPSSIEAPRMGDMPSSVEAPSMGNMLRPRPPGYEDQDGGDVVHPVQGAGDGFWQRKFGNQDARFQVPRNFNDPNRDSVVDMDFRGDGERYRPMYPEEGNPEFGRPPRMPMENMDRDFGPPPPPPGYPFDHPNNGFHPEQMRPNPRPRNGRTMWPYNMNPPGPIGQFASELNSHRPMEDPNMHHPMEEDFDFDYYEMGPPPPGLSRSHYDWYNNGQNDHTRRQGDIDGLLYY